MAYFLLSSAVAFILLAAATLKIIGMSISPVAETGIGLHPVFTIALIELEILLGVSLLLRIWPDLIRYSVKCIFLLFTVVSASAYYSGVASCGCFGSVQMNPLYVCLFDFVVVVAFCFCSPPKSYGLNITFTKVMRPILGAGIFSFLILATLLLFPPEPGLAFSRLRGSTVTLHPLVSDLGNQLGGTEVLSSVVVTNNGSKPLRIAGGTSDCSCIVTDNLPLTLAPGEKIELEIRVNVPETVGAFNRPAFLWTDANVRMVPFIITGFLVR